MIELKKGLHKRLHRPAYFNMVNSMLRSAYYKKSGKNNISKKRENVDTALAEIYNFLYALNLTSPF